MQYKKITEVSRSAGRNRCSRWWMTLLAGVAFVGIVLLTAGPAYLAVHAQNRMTFSTASTSDGHIALGLALRKLSVSGTFLQAPAHPDDETNGLFTYFGYGMGLRVIDVQNNRGDGGQNEIGPELFRDIAVLRTSELLSAHRIDGAEQYFTRAIDYGYSFDPQEVIDKWGRKDIVGDYVRLWRTLRPDVIVTMNIQGRGGDRAHEATTVLVRESFRAAGDPSMYPEQLQQGLRPWQPKKLYFAGALAVPGEAPAGGGRGGGRGRGGADAAKLVTVPSDMYDPLLGRTYAEIANDAHSFHKCQGTGGGAGGAFGGRGGGGGRGGAAPDAGRGATAVAGPAGPDAGRGGAPAGRGGFGGGRGYSLVDTTLTGEMQKPESSLFDGIDTSLTSIAQYAGPNPPAALTAGLATILGEAKLAQNRFADGDDAGAAAPVEAGLAALRALRAQVPSMGLSDSARYEVDFRLKNKERDYEDAVLAAHNVTFEAVADDGLVIDGQPLRLSFQAMNHGASDVTVTRVDMPDSTTLPRASREMRKKMRRISALRKRIFPRLQSQPRPTSAITIGNIRRTRRSRSSTPACPSAFHSLRPRSTPLSTSRPVTPK